MLVFACRGYAVWLLSVIDYLWVVICLVIWCWVVFVVCCCVGVVKRLVVFIMFAAYVGFLEFCLLFVVVCLVVGGCGLLVLWAFRFDRCGFGFVDLIELLVV